MPHFSQEEFEKLTSSVRNRITQDSIKKANGEASAHSFDDIVKENRHIGIAARMTSKPQQWKEVRTDSDGDISYTGNIKAYTGQDIADIFINSVKLYGYSFYPLTGDWRKSNVTQLVLFVKISGVYCPYARFEIDAVVLNDKLTSTHLSKLTDPTPALNCTHKSLLQISEVQTNNLPQLFLGLRSGTELQQSAFKGSAPNVIMI